MITIQSSKNGYSKQHTPSHLKHEHRRCNICRQEFKTEFRYQLFCKKCRAEDESFLFNEWLPRVREPGAFAA